MDWQEGLIDWMWDGKAVSTGTTRYGDGPTVLLLPALSSISTRREMRPLQEALGSSFNTFAVLEICHAQKSHGARPLAGSF